MSQFLDQGHQHPTPRSTGRSLPDQFLVCGLGSLGQHCVANLKTFGVVVKAIDRVRPTQWEVPSLPDILDDLLVGDCRRTAILEQAKVRDCRAILLVTTDERVNLEAALTARLLNPTIRLVMRSSKQNLNDLLTQQLDNLVGFEPSQLAAPAFALEAFGDDLLSFFTVTDTRSPSASSHRFRVVKQVIQPQHPWCNRRVLHELENRDRRILRHIKQSIIALSPDDHLLQRDNPYSPSTQFYTWLPNVQIQAGDVVITIEVEHLEPTALPSSSQSSSSHRSPSHRSLSPPRGLTLTRLWDIKTLLNPRLIQNTLTRFWHGSATDQIRRVAILCGITVIALCIVGTVLMQLKGVVDGPVDGLYTTVVLLLGGYGDLFGNWDSSLVQKLPWWLRLFSLFLTLAGTAFIGVLYALLTEKLLTLKFEFLTRRPPVPTQDHVVVIWLGRVGCRIVELLQDLKQPVVGITNQTIEPDVLPKMPLVTGRIADVLENTNLATAKSVVAVSDDEIQNLELGLLAHRVNPHCHLIIRTYDQMFTNKVAQLFPYAQVLCSSALSAEAFAGAAFGENVISLFGSITKRCW